MGQGWVEGGTTPGTTVSASLVAHSGSGSLISHGSVHGAGPRHCTEHCRNTGLEEGTFRNRAVHLCVPRAAEEWTEKGNVSHASLISGVAGPCSLQSWGGDGVRGLPASLASLL